MRRSAAAAMVCSSLGGCTCHQERIESFAVKSGIVSCVSCMGEGICELVLDSISFQFSQLRVDVREATCPLALLHLCGLKSLCEYTNGC